jgi:hypothetical protein
LKIIERVDGQVGQVTELLTELEKERSYRGVERQVEPLGRAQSDLGEVAGGSVSMFVLGSGC